ncbi:helix-turn-helix domain-containing protein [Limimaricola pyoseonensis]|uniref:HTH cro/C1-type domain-containing protein n=1 Tax=Limimaricola pyoseonensis TaxID=521013 RepID=A0A1G7IHQ5_9RHOB|nr:helix-turn-helix transcriptional regulator [Limimaricola pyoseonensis]SDF12280.1 hypothetical protein SAMN04488567_3474 [Limimaricola pyoseonensis]
MTTSPTATFLKLAIANSDLTQREIAHRAGLPKANVLSMMKAGETKVPLNRIPALAEACGVDAATFVRIAMTEYHPAIWRVLETEFGANLTGDEEKLVESWRYLSERTSGPRPFHEQKRSLATIIIELSRLSEHFRVEEDGQDDLDRLLESI